MTTSRRQDLETRFEGSDPTPADAATKEFSARTEADLQTEANRIFEDVIDDGPDPRGGRAVTEHDLLHDLDEDAAPKPKAKRKARGQAEPEPEPEFTATLEQIGLHAKLAQVNLLVERIPKRGRAPASMGGFEFVQVGDAAGPIRKALAERGVTMLPIRMEIVEQHEHPTSRGGVSTTMTVLITWMFTDADTGEVVTIQSMGTGSDNGDKYSPKAQTNAMKYGLLMAFQLPTGDDPELHDSSDRMSVNSHTRSNSDGGEIVIGASNVGPVLPGGRMGNVSEAQISEVGRLSRRLKLGPTAIAAVIEQVMPEKPVPAFPADSDNKEKQGVILAYLRTLTSDEAGDIITTMIKALNNQSSEEAET